jgi:hypothetical protein
MPSRPLLVYRLNDLVPNADATFSTTEAATPIGTFVLPENCLPAGVAMDVQLHVYLTIPSGTATIRIREGHPQSGTILFSMSTTTSAAIVSSSTFTLTSTGAARLLYLTAQGTAAGNSMKMATLVLLGEADPTTIFDYKRFGQGLDPV